MQVSERKENYDDYGYDLNILLVFDPLKKVIEELLKNQKRQDMIIQKIYSDKTVMNKQSAVSTDKQIREVEASIKDLISKLSDLKSKLNNLLKTIDSMDSLDSEKNRK